MGETSMHRTLLTLGVSAIATVLALSGCDTQSDADTSAPAPAPAASSAAPADTAPSSPAAEATNDAATVKACENIQKDIKDNAKKVAKAEKIGPPAGHIAVSAQWIAGSAAVVAHSIEANEKVSAAADEVQKEMRTLSDEYNESAKAKPSKKKLDTAIKNLTAACSAS
ncbi:hypothetical protein [Actinoplanes sp. NPDC089786]|uniref:hypothetical protein n=1 Tax=Actinoplanes sp. NPDC089786 TaxID=3155185 RepID=UPI003414017F